MKSIEFAFRMAKRRLQAEIEEEDSAFSFLVEDDYEPYVDIEDFRGQIDIANEIKMYSDMLSKSRDEGWFYPDLDGTLEDNLVACRR